MSIEKPYTCPEESTFDINELPSEFKERAIEDLSANLNESYKQPTTNLERLKEFLYQEEIEGRSTGDYRDYLYNTHPFLHCTLANEDFCYPPGDMKVEVLKKLIRRTTNPFIESRCWELLKQNKELAILKNSENEESEKRKYQKFVEQYQNDFDIEADIIPVNAFSRLLSRTIINTIEPENENLVDLFAEYTKDGSLLHEDAIINLTNDAERLKALSICHKKTRLKEYLLQSRNEMIWYNIPQDFMRQNKKKNKKKMKIGKAEYWQKKYEKYIEECAKEVLYYILD